MPTLQYIVDGAVSREIKLSDAPLRIGRGPDNDIQLVDAAVSNNHAQLVTESGTYLEGHVDVYVEDRGSTNGTLVNGFKIKRHLLKHGDMVRIGQSEFRFQQKSNQGMESTRIVIDDDMV